MRTAIAFLGANLFLLGMLAAGAVLVVALVRIAQLAGAGPEAMTWLYWPIGMLGIATTYYAGKFGHHLLSKVI